MIDDIDEALRQLLIRDLPIKSNEVDIAFNQPKREWSSRISRPTLNLYLYDVRENAKLRQHTPIFEVERTQDGKLVSQRPRAIRIDLMYMVTAWATDPGDEHRLLSRSMMTFLRHRAMPADLVPEAFNEIGTMVPIDVAQRDMLEKPTDLWGVMDNEMRPAYGLRLTVAFNPHTPTVTPAVRSAKVGLGQSERPADTTLSAPDGDSRRRIGGQLRAKNGQPFEGARMSLVERAKEIVVREDGVFVISNLPDGKYTLEINVPGRQPVRKKIVVPAEEYLIEL
jgi:hypothetical protein